MATTSTAFSPIHSNGRGLPIASSSFSNSANETIDLTGVDDDDEEDMDEVDTTAVDARNPKRPRTGAIEQLWLFFPRLPTTSPTRLLPISNPTRQIPRTIRIPLQHILPQSRRCPRPRPTGPPALHICPQPPPP
ncbi:hypothetical protein M422DRAFT_249999 [Sphaerobolus stellatus SS14]|nr:hypothetical protein M422DRAFT_249999 [Sphaerobolus stellatus SS14]